MSPPYSFAMLGNPFRIGMRFVAEDEAEQNTKVLDGSSANSDHLSSLGCIYSHISNYIAISF